MSSAPSKKISELHYELITLGDELLLGRTANGHLTFIGEQLARRGVALRRNVTITDSAAAIAEQFSESWAGADVVITTGGLGPTCDDRTREVIAAVLGRTLVFDSEIERAIEERFARAGRKMSANNLKQAYKPEGALVLANPNGTAPGLWVEQGRKFLVMLPGPPSELRPMFTEQVLLLLAARGLLGATEDFVAFRTAGVGESALETLLQPIFEREADLKIAFCAHQGAVDVRLSSESGATPLEQIKEVARECGEMLGEDLVCFGDATLADVVCRHLLAVGCEVAVAEDFSAGILSRALSDAENGAVCFAGGVISPMGKGVAQMFEEKVAQGIFGEERAIALACDVAAKFSAAYGLALISMEERGAWRIAIGLHSPSGDKARELRFSGRIDALRERATTATLDFFRRELLRLER